MPVPRLTNRIYFPLQGWRALSMGRMWTCISWMIHYPLWTVELGEGLPRRLSSFYLLIGANFGLTGLRRTNLMARLFQDCIKSFLAGKARILVTHQLQYLRECDQVAVLDKGVVAAHCRPGDFGGGQGAGLEGVSDILKEFLVVEGEEPEGKQEGEELVSSSSSLGNGVRRLGDATEGQPPLGGLIEDAEAKGDENDAAPAGVNPNAELRQSGSVRLAVYLRYLRSGMPAYGIPYLAVVFLVAQCASVGADYWLSSWSAQPPGAQRGDLYPTVYSILVASTIFFAFARTVSVYITCLNCSKNLFKSMLASALRAPITFFHQNPHGRVLNRFTCVAIRSPRVVSWMSPPSFRYSYSLVVSGWRHLHAAERRMRRGCLRGHSTGLGRHSCPATGLVTEMRRAGCAGSSFAAAATCEHPDRLVKRLESTTRSPVYSFLSETLDGLATVRAYDAVARFNGIFSEAVNQNTRAYYLFLGSARWLGIRIDVLAATFLSVTTFLTVTFRQSIAPNLVALSLAYVLQLIGLVQWSIRMSIEIEINMIAIERMLEYTRLPPEAPEVTDLRPDRDWPRRGVIEFRNASLAYPGREDKPVLKGINMKVEAHEKIGIVGRTGAGKSSMLNALFRMVEPTPAGSIVIDDVDISKLGLADLRSKVAIIPQEPFLFKGTIRYNLDPFGVHSDHELWEALGQAELKAAVEKLAGGLDAPVVSFADNADRIPSRFARDRGREEHLHRRTPARLPGPRDFATDVDRCA
ncbi:MAG: hypothetical protein BJ554DRAFT_4296 [Olpidium bornovanus]|uniref:ABC transmembrane type-1 domain-containing protein n=1 Tax=Olpidium bornovanus TaxID=278681 RepID=A0A8H8DLW3_9FUNG|nr:MAG: hypothetical protein BJ554DRAFT_4296 [Olpidium bornovanus]